jgi:hypothetical protein
MPQLASSITAIVVAITLLPAPLGPSTAASPIPRVAFFGFSLINTSLEPLQQDDINLYMKDAESGQMEFVKSVDIRGNTDESWRHGLDYMLQHYLLREP